ncbi:C-C motif chemokine 4 homolog [Clarias gariepinus]|uniref:C-C motif chemokine 4 homolog n=1 Tax=Clarias gariepinus TaxID=13013 RepID=UPI00234D850D|nr:C-C motif chemokine 4 homolog [Clarias gariepinus]
MSSCSLLLVLLVLTCLQSSTTAQHVGQPESCCFTFQTATIPLNLIKEYIETQRACPKPGIIFIMKNGRRRCADPEVQWVKAHMDSIDQLFMQA